MSRNWQTITQYTEVGYTRKTHGKNGELFLTIKDQFVEDVLQSQFLFLNLHGIKVPFEIMEFRDVGDILVKFEGIDNPDEASVLVSKQISLPAFEIGDQVKDEVQLKYGFLEGYIMHDSKYGQVGRIHSVQAFPQQEMAAVKIDIADVLIPLVEEFIIQMDSKKKIIYVDLPEGLLEM